MRVGDRVLLKASSQWRLVLGEAADQVGHVSSVVGLMITVDYPDVPFYTRQLPSADFARVEDAANPTQVGQWQELVALLDSRTVAEPQDPEEKAAAPVEAAG